jgi:hypothetical protein
MRKMELFLWEGEIFLYLVCLIGVHVSYHGIGYKIASVKARFPQPIQKQIWPKGH